MRRGQRPPSSVRGFNPRTHEGCDLMPLTNFKLLTEFQSTHPRGVRLILPYLILSLPLFQSTHPRGVRRNYLKSSLKRDCFNPRTHEGCDLPSGRTETLPVVSIHAPTRGATYAIEIRFFAVGVSIHAPTRGATIFVLGLISALFVSIHAPTRGAT